MLAVSSYKSYYEEDAILCVTENMNGLLPATYEIFFYILQNFKPLLIKSRRAFQWPVTYGLFMCKAIYRGSG